MRRAHLAGVRLAAGRIAELTTDDGHRYRARVYVDASYEGDLLAAAGVSYTVGREASTVYGESLAGGAAQRKLGNDGRPRPAP